METQEVTYIVDKIDSKINLLFDKVQTKYSLEKYSDIKTILEYFAIDKPNFLRLVDDGMPVIKIGSRWKGKLGEIENWFKNRNKNITTN